MEFVSPTEWGAEVNYDDWTDHQYVKDLIAVHWGGPPPQNFDAGPDREMEILRAYESYHLHTKGWRGIAYGYAIGASGTVYRLRGRNNYGAHQGDQDGDGISNNKEVIPLLFIMGQGQTATPIMWEKAKLLRKWLQTQTWTRADLPVTGHRVIQPKPTSCPGDENMGIIQSLDWDDVDTYVPMQLFKEFEKRTEDRITRLETFDEQIRGLD